MDVQQQPNAGVLYDQLLAATEAKKIEWDQDAVGAFTAKFLSGTVRVSQPVIDQRDGDYCAFVVYDASRKEVASITTKTELWQLINRQPASNVIESLLSEIKGL